MARFRKTVNVITNETEVVPFTAQEELDRDAEEAAYAALPPPTDAERIDAAFPQTDVARVIFEAFFEIANRVITLENGTIITKAQLRDWLIAKLP